MPRKRAPKLWSFSTGERGEAVRIYEPRKGARLRWDYRDTHGKRTRPEVRPPITVRADERAKVDPVLAARAEQLCKTKHAELTLSPADPKAPDVFTVGKAYKLFFNVRYKALPASDSARVHHTASRAFWLRELGEDTPWNDVRPADVTAAILALKDAGKVPTAEKRLSNLRTLYTWLTEEMELEVRDITRGRIKLKERLTAGYEPKQPRLSPDQMARLRKVLPDLSWRTRLFFTLLMSSGTRGGQARTAMRSMLNDPLLQPPPPKDMAPHGWFLFSGVKGQRRHLTFLTKHQREVIDETLAGPFAEWEQRFQEHATDYPLIPSGRIDRGEMIPTPISDRALRYELDDILEAAKIPHAERLGFHAIRRAWADIINAKLGRTATKSAGGWSREETVDIYLSRYQPEHIEQARKVMEVEEKG